MTDLSPVIPGSIKNNRRNLLLGSAAPATAAVAPNQPDSRKRRRAAADPMAHAFTIPDAQAMGAPGTTTIYSLFKSGKLKKIRVCGRTMIEGDSLRALLRGAA